MLTLTRPKSEQGIALDPPHQRLAEAPQLRQIGALALAQDSRSAIWSTSRKVVILNKAIDHVVDGDKVPGWVFKKDGARPDNHCLHELWRLAVKAISAAYKPQEARAA